MAPNAWRTGLAKELATLMGIQFFVMHSSIFLGAMGASKDATAGDWGKLVFFLALIYVPVFGGFAFVHGGLPTALTFAWLLAGRVLAATAASGADGFAAKRLRFQWANDAGFYIVAGLLAAAVPWPAFGFAHTHSRIDGWLLAPQNIMAWGFLSFLGAGVMKLLERRQWIEDWDETPAA